MPKLIVEIDLGPRVPLSGIMNEREWTRDGHTTDWFPTGDPDRISVDSAFLNIDPTEDSFYLFKLLEVKGD